MKYILITLLLLFPISVLARLEKSAYEKYSTDVNITTTTKVTWTTVDDAEKTCNDIRIKQKGSPYPYKVDACSKWTRHQFNVFECHIITNKNVNNDIVGHEIRHCFQGNFH